MSKTTKIVYVCDGCGKTTNSRYIDRWVSFNMSRGTDDDTPVGGETHDACSANCAGRVATDRASSLKWQP